LLTASTTSVPPQFEVNASGFRANAEAKKKPSNPDARHSASGHWS
jgi:hypothetical protein